MPEKLPVLLLHGGPGIPSDRLEPLEALADTGRPVIFYDQLGSGNSDQPNDPALWSIDLFLKELVAVRTTLALDRVHLLGYSWGGSLGLEYALTQPLGLASLVTFSCHASTPMAQTAIQQVYNGLSEDVRKALRRHEAKGTIDDPEYLVARRVFVRRHVCRIDPWPAFLERSIARANWAIGTVMRDRDDRHAPGGLKNWDVTPFLKDTRVPTLALGGRHDGIAPGQDAVLRDGIPSAKWVRFEESSHCAHAEEPERFLTVVDDFLTSVERATIEQK